VYCERGAQATPCELPGRTHLADSSHSNLAGVLLESLSSAPIPSLIFHPLAETRLSNQILLQLLLFPPPSHLFCHPPFSLFSGLSSSLTDNSSCSNITVIPRPRFYSHSLKEGRVSIEEEVSWLIGPDALIRPPRQSRPRKLRIGSATQSFPPSFVLTTTSTTQGEPSDRARQEFNWRVSGLKKQRNCQIHKPHWFRLEALC
jgi:hypothetical protein